MMWEFEFQSTYEDDVFFNTRLELALVPGANEVTLEQALKDEVPLIKRATLQCSCFESQQEHCAHIAAMVTFLRQKIGGLDVDSAVDFLKKMMTDGPNGRPALVNPFQFAGDGGYRRVDSLTPPMANLAGPTSPLGYDANFENCWLRTTAQETGWLEQRTSHPRYVCVYQ